MHPTGHANPDDKAPRKSSVRQNRDGVKQGHSEKSATLGQKLRELRDSVDMSQLQLAKLLDVPRSTVSKWENGETMLPAIHLGPICHALRVGPSKVLGVEEERIPDSAFERLNYVLRAEGTELATKALSIPEAVWPEVFSGRLRVSLELMEELAGVYKVPVQWLRTGDPAKWDPALSSGISVRFRFLRICLGEPAPSDNWKLIEASDRYAREHAQEAYSEIDREQVITAVSPERNAELGLRFPYDYDWVLTGKIGLRKNPSQKEK